MPKEMTKSERAKRFIAKGVLRKATGRFVAQYGIPGAPPFTLKEGAGLKEFADQQEAELAAMRALVDLLNAPRTLETLTAWPDRKTGKWSPEDLAAALRTVGLEPDVFEEIYGAKQGRVRQWLRGEEMVPHPARVLLSVFSASPEAIEVAIEETRSAQISK